MVAHPQIPTSTLEHLKTLQDTQTQLARAFGRGQPALRDPAGNILALNPDSPTPLLAAQGHGVALSMADRTLTVTTEDGQAKQGIAADTVNVDSAVNATYLNASDSVHAPTMYASTKFDGDTYGTHFGNVGDSSNAYTLYGYVAAPSERALKHDIKEFDAGALVDAIPSPQWRYIPAAFGTDKHEHAGVMVDDIAEHAPWLVRRDPGTRHRHYNPSDLIGVLWAALRESRHRATELETRVARLEAAKG